MPAARQVSCHTPRQPVTNFSRLGIFRDSPEGLPSGSACALAKSFATSTSRRAASGHRHQSGLHHHCVGWDKQGAAGDIRVTARISLWRSSTWESQVAAACTSTPRTYPDATAQSCRSSSPQPRAVSLRSCWIPGALGAETAAMGPEVKEQVEGVAPSSLRRSAAGADFSSTLMAQSTASAAL